MAELLMLHYRPMRLEDLGRVPIQHQGEPEEVAARIAELGSSAILAFDGDRCVGQLQFRRYDPRVRSPRGIWQPDYWGDHGDDPPRLVEPALNLYCYHVGQTDDTDARDARYQGIGVGVRLLEEALAWADHAGFAAVAAKAPPPYRPVAAFMGGHPPEVYEAHGFRLERRAVEPDLRALIHQLAEGTMPDVDDGGELVEAFAPAARALVADGVPLEDLATVALMVRRAGDRPATPPPR